MSKQLNRGRQRKAKRHATKARSTSNTPMTRRQVQNGQRTQRQRTKSAILTDPDPQDASLINRAVQQAWEIPPEARTVLPARMYGIATKALSVKDQIAATKALIAMTAQNLKVQEPENNRANTVNISFTQIVQAIKQVNTPPEQSNLS